MQKLGLNEDLELIEDLNEEPESGFWRRQFQKKATAAQKRFDWVFGVIMPVVCFTFDPIVFQTKDFFGDYKTLGYLLSYTSVMALAAWLIWGAKLKWANAFLSGFFAVISVVALVIGITILPLSLLGLLFFFIGALGFTPLFTALVFMRNARRSFDAARIFFERKTLVHTFLLVALLSAIVPPIISVEINRLRDEQSARRLFEF